MSQLLANCLDLNHSIVTFLCILDLVFNLFNNVNLIRDNFCIRCLLIQNLNLNQIYINMQQSLKRQDYLTLHYIVEEAYKKYLKESRISKGPAFNILRVLTAFKQVFPTTPERLYKLIMVITKKYNPQTLQQWTNGIQKINCIDIKNSQSSIHLSQSVINQSESRLSKYKHNQNSVKTYKEQLDNQIDYIESKRSRLKFSGDFKVTEPAWAIDYQRNDDKQNVMEFSNKQSLKASQNHHAHYISFQPNYKDSINKNVQKSKSQLQDLNHNAEQTYYHQKKINPYHEITRIDNLSRIQDQEQESKDDSKTLYSHNYRTEQNSHRIIPSKTQRNYSQIRIMGLDSKDSEISIKKSEIVPAEKSHQALECQDFNMTLEEWETLNERTTTFYQFNLKLKAFSAVIANYQAYQSDRFLKNKADIFHSSYLESKVILALKNNVQIQIEVKQKIERADEFHNEKLCLKVWKVLEVLKNLKIQKRKRVFEIPKMNRMNYEFLISFMFEQKSITENSPTKKLTYNLEETYDFEKKAEYFSKTHNFENVWNIYKCFGLNINISKERLTEFFRNYHRCLQKNVFQAFRRNADDRKQRYLRLHDNRLNEKAFSILLSRLQIAKELNKKLFRAESYADKKLKQKSYKILLSIVYSTKVFSKRQEFIECQRLNKIKMGVLKKWASEYKRNVNQRRQQSEKLEMFCSTVHKFILGKSLQSVIQESTRMGQEMKKCKMGWEQKLMKKVFKHFSTLLTNKKRYMRLCQNGQVQFQKKIISKWLRLTQVQQGINKIEFSCNKIIFRSMFIPLSRTLVKKYMINQEAEKDTLKECFENLKLYQIQNKNQRAECFAATTKLLSLSYSNEFICVLRNNYEQILRNRQIDCLKEKSEILEKNFNRSRIKSFYIGFKNIHSHLSILKQKSHKIPLLIKQSSLKMMLTKTQSSITIKQNQKSLENYLKSLNSENFCVELKRNQLRNKQNKVKINLQKKLLSSFLAKVSGKYNQMKKNQQKSQRHFIRSSQRKVLLGLVENFIEISSKTHRLQETLENYRKKQYFSVFKQKTKINIETKSKQLIVAKRQVLCSLRENIAFQTKKKILELTIRQVQIAETLQNLKHCIEQNDQVRRIEQLSNNVNKKLFWLRFNGYFIRQLFQKKHIFMAYKFRALKLYGMAFRNWKQSTGITIGMNTNKRRQKEVEKQKFSNHRQKQTLQMCRPTECSLISK